MSKLNSKLAGLLSRLQERLNRVDAKSRETAENVKTVSGELVVRTASLASQAAIHAKLIDNLQAAQLLVVEKANAAIDSRDARHSTREQINSESIDTLRSEVEARETRQGLRDQNNVQSLVKLTESTQKGFDLVRHDVEELLKLSQKLNERVGKAESRVEKMEEPLCAAPSTIDQALVNSKLSGVYDAMEGLEERLENVNEQIASMASSAAIISNRVEELGERKPSFGDVCVNAIINERITRLTQRVEKLEVPAVKTTMKGSRLILENGDSIVVIAKTPITVADPADEYAYVAQQYYVVADRSYPATLQLVPLGVPTKVRTEDVEKSK